MSADSEKTSSAEGEQAVEEMTKEVEIVDIGGEAFSLVRLADQFNKGAYSDIHCSCAKREIFDFASFDR